MPQGPLDVALWAWLAAALHLGPPCQGAGPVRLRATEPPRSTPEQVPLPRDRLQARPAAVSAA